MTILMLSLGGGGGNILRSLKALFRRDLATVHKSDPRYAERLRRALVTRFLDTNEFSLSDVPGEERLIIGAQTTGRLGARHDPEVARRATLIVEQIHWRNREKRLQRELARIKAADPKAAKRVVNAA